MKAPGADYSPIQQAISARTNAIRAGYQAKAASNWKNSYDLQKSAINLSQASNVVGTVANLASAGLNFAESMYRIKENNDQKDLTLTEGNVLRAMETAIRSNPDEVTYSKNEYGIMEPVYSEALQGQLSKIMEDGFSGKEYSKSIQDMVGKVQEGIWTNAKSTAMEATLRKQLDTAEALTTATRNMAMEADVASGLTPVTATINGNDYTVGQSYYKTLQAEGLDDKAMELALIEGQQAYRAGVVGNEWRRTLHDTGNYAKALEVIDNAREAGTISQEAANAQVEALNAAFRNMDYDPQQTKLNYAIDYYSKGEHAGNFDALLKELDRKYPGNYAANIELANQALNYGATTNAASVQNAQKNISLAIEQGDDKALQEAIDSVPGSKIELQDYADKLKAVKANHDLSVLQDDVEKFKQDHTWQETAEYIQKLEGVSNDDKKTLKDLLLSWEKSSESLSIEQQQKNATQVVEDTNKAKELREKALGGMPKDIEAYRNFLKGRDAAAYGGEAQLLADTTAQLAQFDYDLEMKGATNILRKRGYDAAKADIEKSSLTHEQKQTAIQALDQERTNYLAEVKNAATTQVQSFAYQLSNGQIDVGTMGSQIGTVYGSAQAAASKYPEEFRLAYMEQVEAQVSSAYSSGIGKLVSIASNSKDENGEDNSYEAMVSLQRSLVDMNGSIPSFLTTVHDSAKTSVGAQISSWEDTYGSNATQMFINGIRSITAGVKDGSIGGKEASAQIRALYGVASSGGTYDFGTKDNPNVYSAASISQSNLEQINKAYTTALKEICPDFDSDAILKNQYELLSESLYSSTIKDLTPEQLATYQIAQANFQDSVFDLAVKWNGRDSQKPPYTIEQYTADLDKARSVFSQAWLSLRTSDVNENNGYSTAVSNMSTIFPVGEGTPEYVSFPTSLDGDGWYNRGQLSYSNITEADLQESEDRVYQHLHDVEGVAIVPSAAAAYRPNPDGSVSMKFPISGGGDIELNTNTQQITVHTPSVGDITLAEYKDRKNYSSDAQWIFSNKKWTKEKMLDRAQDPAVFEDLVNILYEYQESLKGKPGFGTYNANKKWTEDMYALRNTIEKARARKGLNT